MQLFGAAGAQSGAGRGCRRFGDVRGVQPAEEPGGAESPADQRLSGVADQEGVSGDVRRLHGGAVDQRQVRCDERGV